VMFSTISFSWAFRPPLGPVSLAPERAEPLKSTKRRNYSEVPDSEVPFVFSLGISENGL